MTIDFSAGPPTQPGVVFWFKVYIVLNALMYVAVAGLLAAIVVFVPGALEEELGPAFLLIGLAALCVVLALVYLASLFFPRVPWAWVYDLVLICLGFTGCLTLPFSVALLIYWVKPEAKSWFGTT